jgi:hypothetical protein
MLIPNTYLHELPNMAGTRINYISWLLRVVAWDGILPLVVWVAPYVLKVIVPNREEPRMLAVILTAICVFLLRWVMGVRHIEANRCSPAARQIQYFCFFAGLVVMLLTDAFALAMHDMLQPVDMIGMLIVLSLPFSIYLTLMTAAMYPGREPAGPPAQRIGNWEISG